MNLEKFIRNISEQSEMSPLKPLDLIVVLSWLSLSDDDCRSWSFRDRDFRACSSNNM
jgi:hypothetical protein